MGHMRTITIDPEKCVACGDCGLICPVKVYTGWRELSGEKRREISQLSLEERHIRFSGSESDKASQKAKQLAEKVFAYIDVASCLACGQCSNTCWKGAITVIAK
jgi:NAD-dependent dihydropyrimidine dehydrogenase PreA subunit